MNTLPVPCRSILGGCFVRLAGCLLFSTTPHGCEKDHIAPQLCQKEKDTEEKKGGGGCSRFTAYRLAPSVEGHGLSGNALEVLKSSTYNVHFKSYLVLRVLA